MVDPQRDADRDALQAMKYACTLVAKSLDMSFQDGMIVLPPKVQRYIQDIIQGDEGGATS